MARRELMGRRIVKASILAGVFFVILVFVLPVIQIANEEEYLREELNNTYINENFVNWKPADIVNWDSFLIPENWNISKESGILYIEDDFGSPIAVGTILGRSDSQFHSREEFLTATLTRDVSDYTEEHIPGFVPIKASTLGKIEVSTTSEKVSYYYLSLNSHEDNGLAQLYFVFPSAIDNLVDIAQAIVYSFCFAIQGGT